MPPLDDEAGAALVGDEAALWASFLEVLGRHGSVSLDSAGRPVFRAAHESATRTFCLSAHELREYFVIDIERQRSNDADPLRVDVLPAWFIDELNEFVGSYEEPFEFEHVRLTPDGFEPVLQC